MAELTSVINQFTVGGGSEKGIIPAGWMPANADQYTSTLVSGIDAVNQYKSLASVAKGFTGAVPGWVTSGAIPKWAADIASKGGLWLPMSLEASSLLATVEAVAGKSFAEIAAKSKELAKFGNIAELAKSGIAVASDVLSIVEKLRNDLSVATVVQSVSDLVNNVATVVADVGKALKIAAEVAQDVFASIPFCGMVASAIGKAIALLIESGPFKPYDRAAVEAKMRQADDEAAKIIAERCKFFLTQANRPTGTSLDAANQPTLGPADLFRPFSYWIYRCAEAYTKQTGSYAHPFGRRGLYDEPVYPPPPMSPVFFYFALCGDVVPPMLRPTTCGVKNYQRGWLNSRYEREPLDCYTASVLRLRKKYGPNFGIPLQTRKLMWRMIQSVLACCTDPQTSKLAFQGDDNGKTFYTTLQQICFNEYLSGRINEELLADLNADLVSRHGFVPGNEGWSEGDSPLRVPIEGFIYYGAATCRDADIRVDKQFLDELQKFQLTTLGATVETKQGKKKFYNSAKQTWEFDQRLIAESQKGRTRGALVVGPRVTDNLFKSVQEMRKNRSLGDSMGPELRDRLADGPMPWTSVLAPGLSGISDWMRLRSAARRMG